MVVKKTNADGLTKYNVGFCVTNREYLPGRPLLNGKKLGITCIEGIRVSNHLPGFGEDGLVGIFAVNNNVKLQTTVSRSDLEEDNY